MLYKRGVLKNFSKFSDKHKQQSSGGVLSKDVLKNFVKLTEKTSLPESPRKKTVLESLFNKVGVLGACNFIKEDSDTGYFL